MVAPTWLCPLNSSARPSARSQTAEVTIASVVVVAGNRNGKARLRSAPHQANRNVALETRAFPATIEALTAAAGCTTAHRAGTIARSVGLRRPMIWHRAPRPRLREHPQDLPDASRQNHARPLEFGPDDVHQIRRGGRRLGGKTQTLCTTLSSSQPSRTFCEVIDNAVRQFAA